MTSRNPILNERREKGREVVNMQRIDHGNMKRTNNVNQTRRDNVNERRDMVYHELHEISDI